VGLTRIVKNKVATLSHVFEVDETPTDPTGTPTCAIVDANGTAVVSGSVTVVGGSTGRVTVSLAAQAALKKLVITWTATVAGTSTTEVDYAEVVGGHFFSLAKGRSSDSSLSDDDVYTTDDLKEKRLETEVECEMICDRAFVPRYDRVVLDGTGTGQLLLKHSDPTRSVADVRTIRRIAVAPDMDETFVDLTSGELDSVSVGVDGTLTRTDFAVFTAGRANVIVEFEYGWDAPPPTLVAKALQRFRTLLNWNKSGIPDRASSFTPDGGGGVFRLDMPNTWKVGIPDIDAEYSRWGRRSGTGTGSTGRTVPASRSLVYNPQAFSMFHGRR
jgi:hypothetical protein